MIGNKNVIKLIPYHLHSIQNHVRLEASYKWMTSSKIVQRKEAPSIFTALINHGAKAEINLLDTKDNFLSNLYSR